MLTKLFFPTGAGVRVDRAWWEGQTLHLAATTTRRAARCPLCRRRSTRIHSRYGRTIADLPCAGAVVALHLRTRRFVCRVRWCRRTVFTERLPALVAPSARRTTRLCGQLQRTGFALGGAPGAQHASATGTPVSRRTLLRLVRAAPVPQAGPVRVLGVDDWSQKRGRTYGTILVNLETQQVIELLPGRTGETLAAWLQQHPEVEIISRDRGGAYADGARQGAPQAVQVADRFHLVKNVIESLERFLTRTHHAVRQAARAQCSPAPESLPPDRTEEPGVPALAAPATRVEREQHERRARRHARYEEVMALHAEGYSQRAVARRAGLSRHTVQRFVQADGFPERTVKARRRTMLTPYEPYLRERWESGEQNATLLWQEIRVQGFGGGASNVRHHVAAWRTGPAQRRCRRTGRTSTAPAPPTYTTRQTLWLLLRPLEDVTTEEQVYLTHLYHACPHAALAQALVHDFRTLLREHDVTALYAWLRSTGACPIQELRAVARGMWLDRRAIEAAVALEWSQGQTEGQVNRLKVLKRTMYGRASFEAAS